MNQNSQNYEGMEIDLSSYIKVIIKRKKTLIVVFLLTLAIGFTNILLSPKIYRVSMMIQPPVIGPSFTGANDLEPAEKLKGLIINNVYDEELKKISNIDLSKSQLDFKVVIPSTTNILQVNIDLEGKKKDFGVVLLRNLATVISNSYTKGIEAKVGDIINQINLNKQSIVRAKEKDVNLKEQIDEVKVREDKLREEIKLVNDNTAQILTKRETLLRNNVATENVSILLLTNFIQNNSSYSNQLNNQLSDLSIRRVKLNLEIKDIDSQINSFQMTIDKLNISKGFISNLKIISPPRVSSSPIGPNKKMILAISIVMGFFLGVFVIFFQEFWVNSPLKK